MNTILLRLRLPKTLQWVLNLLLLYTALFTLLRCATLVLFKPEGETAGHFFSAFLLGLRFDLRWISLLLFPIVLLSCVPRYSPYHSPQNKKWWTWYLALTTFFVVLLYAIDFGCFAYFHVRLGATVFNFIDDAAIATTMLWEMYPLAWMIAGLLLLVVSLRALFQRLHQTVSVKAAVSNVENRRRTFVVAAALMALCIYGGFPQPLRRDAAFELKDDFGGYLALNPLQSVFSTMGNRNPQFDEGKAKDFYPVLSNWMGWNPAATNYKREESPYTPWFRTKPNVVLVLCESFSF